MVRFTHMCNKQFSGNDTEATDNYFEGNGNRTTVNKATDCYGGKDADCTELKYSDLGMGMEGVQGIYAKGSSYGTRGYYMDFNGADGEDMMKKIAHLKKIKWIDEFTKAVAVKWTVLN